MPIFALILIALAAGALVAFVASRYPTPVVGEAPADAAAVTIEAEMEKHPWLLRLVRDRLDPATATGLALTFALGLAILGGILIGLLAYLVGAAIPSSTSTCVSGNGESTTPPAGRPTRCSSSPSLAERTWSSPC